MSNIANQLSEASNRLQFDGAPVVRLDSDAFGPGGLIALLRNAAIEIHTLAPGPDPVEVAPAEDAAQP